MNANISPQAKGATQRRQRRLKLLIAAAIAAGVLVFALAAAGIWYLFTSTRYDKAVEAMESGRYAEAMDITAAIPPWFEDNDALMVYTQGCAALATGDYLNASYFYRLAGRFRDAEDRSAEASYLLGCAYADVGSGKEAKDTLRDVLGRAEYSESEMMRRTGYLAAARLYDMGEHASALRFFQKNWNYLESGKFLTLIEARQCADGKPPANANALYDRLVALEGFHDANALMGIDDLMPYYLAGQWDSDGMIYHISLRRKEDLFADWVMDTNLPEPDLKFTGINSYYHIADGVISINDIPNAAGTPAFQFKVISLDEMTVYCVENKSTYTMHRRK